VILQALAKYYERIPGVAQEGFQQQGIPFIIVLNSQGDFKGLLDTRKGEGKKKTARPFIVLGNPRPQMMANSRASSGVIWRSTSPKAG
jgi:CRISPR-associated protein Csd1